MITHSISPLSHVNEQENNLDIRAKARLAKENNAILAKRRILKWFGAISTILLGAATLAPDPFGIPAKLQPWVFLTAILWLLAFCAGMFDL